MFGKRYDGRRVKNVDPFARIMPYIMKTRTDSMTMFEETVSCEGMDAYIARREAEGKKLDYMQIWIAAAVRTIALRPQMNRFIMNGKIYTRPKIWVSFAIHHSFRTEQEETTIKLCFDGTETLDEIADAIHDAVVKETTQREGENSTDTLAKVITKVPSPLIRLIVNTLMFMDRHNIMPKAVIEASPFHTSLFITNLKSLGINHIFHHIYEFGTTGLFLAMGKEKKIPVVVTGNEIVPQKSISFGFVSDERICDGLYFARSLKILKKFLKNPARLEEKLESKVEDVR